MWGSAIYGFFLGIGALLFVEMLVESRIHQSKWRQWKQYMEPMNAWEIFTGRHIPHLRDDGA